MQRPQARPSRTTSWAYLSIALLCTVMACNSLLDVKAPDNIDTSSLEIPVNAQLLTYSAIGDFYCALGAYDVASGLMSGELEESTLTAARWSYDRRDIDPNEALYSTNSCEGLGTYTPIETAIFTADHVSHLLQGWSDTDVQNRQDLIALAASYGGYGRVLLGEGFCSAAIAGGPALTSQQIFQAAIDTFTVAINAAQQAGDDSVLNLALVGRARAELDAGQLSAAAADAAQVPKGFVFNATYDASTDHRTNRIFAENNGHGVTIAPAYRNLNDPRVSVTNGNRAAADEVTPLYLQNKYADGSAPIPIASYTEAQLILAEATGGQAAVDILNQLRADAGLSPLPATSDPNEVKADIAQERARWLFLQGNHLYDVRRLQLPLVPAAGLTYSVENIKGGSYGTQTCMPIPAVETNNNPNAHG